MSLVQHSVHGQFQRQAELEGGSPRWAESAQTKLTGYAVTPGFVTVEASDCPFNFEITTDSSGGFRRCISGMSPHQVLVEEAALQRLYDALGIPLLPACDRTALIAELCRCSHCGAPLQALYQRDLIPIRQDGTCDWAAATRAPAEAAVTAVVCTRCSAPAERLTFAPEEQSGPTVICCTCNDPAPIVSSLPLPSGVYCGPSCANTAR